MSGKTFFVSLISLLLLFSCSKDKKTAVLKKNYSLVWADEFDYAGKPDTTKWNYEIGFIRNNEKQYYTDRLKNARVENGVLILEAHKEKIANQKFKSNAYQDKNWLHYIPKIDTAKYTSASLTTKDLAQWKYGKFKIKAKLPKGIGLWPAIWMLGENRKEVGWPKCGEIDIMEHVGFNKDSIFGTIHTQAYNHLKGTQKGKKVFINNPYDKFHIFSIEWTPEKIDFLLDGKIYYTVVNEHKTIAEWPFGQKFYLKLNIAVGGGLGGQKGIDDSVFPQQMAVDYVRVYQLK
jgi:beta-glucanase (GH16 family)